MLEHYRCYCGESEARTHLAHPCRSDASHIGVLYDSLAALSEVQGCKIVGAYLRLMLQIVARKRAAGL